MEELDEADAALNQSASLEAIGRERTRGFDARAVHLKRGGGLLGKVGDFWYARLHAVSHFGLSQASINFWVELVGALISVQFA